ncbi:RING finger protein 227 [Anabas testudineus]|uniref:RING-type domain-containing protein n=1 Tax=Anabas testudineus TaxID=64144 RepID=A0A3Q1JFN9_ANATE|nr:RING finger protein 227 [Anabas testudineus]
MFSELECGICYQSFNAGRRCPRELHCKHSFCESCLLVLSRPLGSGETPADGDRSIVCPLCRQTTSISGERKMRAELRVDECVLERLLAAGVLSQEDEEDKDQEEERGGQDQHCCEDGEEEASPETPAEDNDSSALSRGAAVRRTWRKVWRKISGKRTGQTGGENCMTNADLRNIAMMSCYMF